AVRGNRGRATRGAAARLPGGPDRGRPGKRPARRVDRRARVAGPPTPAQRAPAQPAHAGPLPRRTPRRGARELPDLPAPARRRARDRAAVGPQGAGAPDPPAGPRTRDTGGAHAGFTPDDRRVPGDPTARPPSGPPRR